MKGSRKTAQGMREKKRSQDTEAECDETDEDDRKCGTDPVP